MSINKGLKCSTTYYVQKLHAKNAIFEDFHYNLYFLFVKRTWKRLQSQLDICFKREVKIQ